MTFTKNILPCLLMLALMGCTESFLIKTIDFESIIIIEGTLTDEMKRQEVRLSKTIQLEDFGQDMLDNAEVSVEDNTGNVFTFSQDMATQVYFSDIEFQAEPNTQYTLKVTTSEGRSYTSKVVELPPKTPIKQIYTEMVSESDKEGVQVFVDTDNTSGAEYFRYEYEETYKVKLPANAKFDWEIIGEFTRFYQIEITPREWTDKEFCYPTINSQGIIQTSMRDLDGNQITRFPIRFLDKKAPVLRERYSILIKQYVQSLESHTFYQTLGNLSSDEGLLTQGQPGFVLGNIKSDTDPEEKVLGYFEASSVSSQRIYFNYLDFGFDLPPYFVECEWLNSREISREQLRRSLEFENYQIHSYDEIGGSPIYYITQSECSECATFSTHIKPDFWEDGS